MMIGKSCVSRIESCGISTSGDREEEVKRRSLRKGKWRKTKLVLFTEPKWNQIFKHLKYYLSIKYDENRNFTTRFINIEIISFFMEISFGKVLAEDESLILINLADKVGGKLETISVDIFFSRGVDVKRYREKWSCRFVFAKLFPFSPLMSDGTWRSSRLMKASWCCFSYSPNPHFITTNIQISFIPYCPEVPQK